MSDEKDEGQGQVRIGRKGKGKPKEMGEYGCKKINT